MSTNSRIGYLENGQVTSVYCHSDGYISYNGVLLNECYKDIDKIKVLVNTNAISSLGTKVNNTNFMEYDCEVPVTERLEEYKSHAFYHYLFDTEKGKWKVYHENRAAWLDDVVNVLSEFKRIEGNGWKNIYEAFGNCQLNKIDFSNNYQHWWDENSRLISSIIDVENNCVDVYYTDYHIHDGKKSEEVHVFVPCNSFAEGEKISDNIWGKTVEDIKREYGLEIKQALDNVIKSCENMNKDSQPETIKNEYYKTSDGFFDYYVNRKTGEKKFKLDKNDVEVERKADDFSRDVEVR